MAFAASRRLGWFAAVFSSAISIASCTLLVDSSGLAIEQPASLDAAGATDSNNESSIPADGSTNEGDGGASDGPLGNSWCSDKAVSFCEDFDTRPIAEQWAEFAKIGGSITLDPGHAKSPPNVLLVSGSDNPIQLGMFKQFSSNVGKRLAFAADVRMESVGVGNVDFLTLEISTGGKDGLFLGFTYDQAKHHIEFGVYEADPLGLSDSLTFTFPLNEWKRVELRLDFENAISDALIDNVSLGQTPIPPNVTVTNVKAGVGVLYADEVSGTWTTRYDNVTFVSE